MIFEKALELLKRGVKVKRKHWGGYWILEDGQIKMYCKDGRVLDIRESDDMLYTLENILADDWEIAIKDNSKLLCGDIIKTYSFADVLRLLKAGNKISRSGWNEKGMWIELQKPDEHSKMTRPYIYLCVPGGSTKQFGEDYKELDRVPWLPSQTDLLAQDWQLVK